MNLEYPWGSTKISALGAQRRLLPAGEQLFRGLVFVHLMFFSVIARGELPPIDPGSWTLAVLPDTQNYSEFYPEIFKSQTQWLVDNREELNITFTLFEGDFTNRNNETQWNNAAEALKILDEAALPYSVVPGNHEYGENGAARTRDTAFFNQYLPVSLFEQMPTFGGVFESGKMDNNFQTFSAGGNDYLLLGLEFGPRDAVLDWADQVLQDYSDYTAILFTHAYTYSDNTRYDWETFKDSQLYSPHRFVVTLDPEGLNDGQEIWDKLAAKHENLKIVLSAHTRNDGTGYLVSEGDAGNVVHQILANYQTRPFGGEGFLRLMEFLPDGDTVRVWSYSPWLDAQGSDPFLTTEDQQFSLSLSRFWPLIPGDINDDGQVGLLDFDVLKNEFGAIDASREQGDLDGNGLVGLEDFEILKNNFGERTLVAIDHPGAEVPEPATAQLLALGLVALLVYRRGANRG